MSPKFPGAFNYLLAPEFSPFTFVVFTVITRLLLNDNGLYFTRLQGDLNGMIGRNAWHSPWVHGSHTHPPPPLCLLPPSSKKWGEELVPHLLNLTVSRSQSYLLTRPQGPGGQRPLFVDPPTGLPTTGAPSAICHLIVGTWASDCVIPSFVLLSLKWRQW